MPIKRAKESFTYWDGQGVPRDISAGDLIDPATSPMTYKGREHLFEDVELHVENKSPVKPVETATAVPGEMRTVTTPVRRPTRVTGKEES